MSHLLAEKGINVSSILKKGNSFAKKMVEKFK